jgi:hypothetical protein
MGYHIKNANLIGPGDVFTRSGVHDITLSRLNPPSNAVTQIYTLANDSTLYGISTAFGSDIATQISNRQGVSCTWNNSFLYNNSVTVNSTNLSSWSAAGTVCIVWANGTTTTTRQLSTQIVSSPYFGRVVTLVFGSIDFSGGYSISEVQNMPSEFQLIATSSQSNLSTPSTATVQNVAGFTDIQGTTFTVSNYFIGGSPSDGAATTKTVFLRVGSAPYGAYYKNTGTGAGHAMINLWPGSAYGYNGTVDNRSTFVNLIARACIQIG